jgi:hypothetical protein
MALDRPPSTKKPTKGNDEGAFNQFRSRFLRDYPRCTRDGSLTPVGDADAAFYPCPPSLQVCVTTDAPLPGYERALEVRRNERQATNELLCYRLLKRLYGAPDPAVVFVDARGNEVPYDWSWTACAGENLVEVRRKSHSVFITAWTRSEAGRESAPETLARFSDTFDIGLRRARYLFDPKTELSDRDLAGFANAYLEKYTAAEELVALGTLHDHPTDWVRYRAGERVKSSPTGTLYQSAIMMFLIALEAFDSLVRDLLGRAEYDTPEQASRIAFMNIEDRLRSLSIHCNGFHSAPFEKSSDIEKRIRSLRKVRNDIVHGNTQRQRIYALSQDGYAFMYAPEMDAPYSRQADRVPVTRGLVRRAHAEYVKAVVDDVVQSIVDALDAAHAHIGHALRNDHVLAKL